MKKHLLFSLMVCIVISFSHCTKEGPRGLRGPAGADGNANVKTYYFADSLKIAWDQYGTINLYFDSVFFIPDSIKKYGVVQVFFNLKDQGYDHHWFPVPGLAYGATFQTRLIIRSDMIQIRAFHPNGASWTGGPLPELAAVRVVLIPATTIVSLRKQGIEPDFSDYYRTMELLDLTP